MKNLANIIILPRTLVWVGQPLISDELKFSYLTKDLFLFDFKADDINGLELLNGRYTHYLFNFDAILRENLKTKILDPVSSAKKLSKYISKFCSHNSIVHTTILNNACSQIFAKYGIELIRKDLQYANSMMPVLDAFEKKFKKKYRTSTRLRYHSYQEVSVAIRLEDESVSYRSSLFDLSLKGLAIKLHNEQHIKNFTKEKKVKIVMQLGANTVIFKNVKIIHQNAKENLLGLELELEKILKYNSKSYECLSRFFYQTMEKIYLEKIQIKKTSQISL